MTVATVAGAQTPNLSSPQARNRPGSIGAALVLSSAGVLLVAIGYAAGRSGARYGMVWYWLGQILVFVPILVRVLSSRLGPSVARVVGGRLSDGQAFALTIGLAINGYAVKWAYSPNQLRFGDELQHWFATTTVVRTGRLFGSNDALPAAVHYPGLEEMGAAVNRMTGLSVTTSAFIIAGVLHLIFVGAIFMLVRRCGGSPTMAALACVIYATGLHFLFFDSMYVYQTAALPFLALAIWAVRGWDRRPHRAGASASVPFAIVAAISIMVVTVSHHVTGIVLAAALVGLAIVLRSRRMLLAAAFAIGCVFGWIALVAPEVWSYLWQPFSGVFGGRSAASSGGAGGSAAWILAVQVVGIIGLLVVFLVAVRASARWRRAHPARAGDVGGWDRSWWTAALIGAGVFFVAGGLRLIGASGPELAARAATFTYIPIAVVAAAVLLAARRPALIAGIVLIAVLGAGARLGGWPPSWELLPGPYVAAGQERSVEPLGVAAAQWANVTLSGGSRVGADMAGWTLVSTYGGKDPVAQVAPLYDDPQWTYRDYDLVDRLGVQYIWVDSRLATSAPPSGTLFLGDPRTGSRTAPIPIERLAKFDAVPGLSRVFDDGTIRIYQVGDLG